MRFKLAEIERASLHGSSAVHIASGCSCGKHTVSTTHVGRGNVGAQQVAPRAVVQL